jgi:2-methylisocitrate lyase-like PEP mutase family enzyme
VSLPVNFMVGAKGQCFPVEELAEAGVRRISLGPTLFLAAMAAFLSGAREIRERGTFAFAQDLASFRSLNALMAGKG